MPYARLRSEKLVFRSVDRVSFKAHHNLSGGSHIALYLIRNTKVSAQSHFVILSGAKDLVFR